MFKLVVICVLLSVAIAQYRPGPAPQPQGGAPAYQPAPQQYSAPAPQSYSAPQQYRPAPAQQYRPEPAQQYRPAPQAAASSGHYDPRKDDPYYQDTPPYIDVERLSYNIDCH
ncbi:hypothetical protein X975_00951, partial [Stegodyphus mimosarum]